MKCPNCSREVAEHALFCGYCGAAMDRMAGAAAEGEPTGAAPGELRGAAKRTGPDSGSPPAGAAGGRKKKKRTGLKILLVCALLAVMAGTILGFAAARGILDWRKYLPGEEFVWTDRAEGTVQTDEVPEADEVPDEKEDGR